MSVCLSVCIAEFAHEFMCPVLVCLANTFCLWPARLLT